MNFRTLIIIFSLALFFGCGEKYKNPNIIIIFTDDQGYGDLGCYGATKFKTPYIDTMAREGILFTDKLSPLKKRLLKGKLNNISKGNITSDYKMRFSTNKKRK